MWASSGVTGPAGMSSISPWSVYLSAVSGGRTAGWRTKNPGCGISGSLPAQADAAGTGRDRSYRGVEPALGHRVGDGRGVGAADDADQMPSRLAGDGHRHRAV